MAYSEAYRRQVALLLRVLPDVAAEACFALKGGTAINLFVRDMPRLSVDIDLTYLPVAPRADSLRAIDAAMARIKQRIQDRVPRVQIRETRNEGVVTRLLVRADNAQIKIEVTPVLRGCVLEPRLLPVSAKVEDTFAFAEMQVVSFADLYGGKLIAALDRQHPRDFFDVRELLAHEGVDDALRRAFVVYVLSSSEPITRLLAPPRKDISKEFLRAFEGMTAEPVPLAELTNARDAMIDTVVGNMPVAHRQFLVSFARGEPDWALLDVTGADQLSAVRWRQQKFDRLSQDERAVLAAELEQVWA